jgi:Na+-translocating ferredoxin:NAD+ oxidoreductase RnfG subunit
MRFSNGATIALFFFSFMQASIAHGKLLSREEALRSAFPEAKIESTMIFLTEQELEEASKLSAQKIESALVARYTAISNGKEIGRAYLDTNTVRTKKQSVLVLVNPDGTIKRVEIVAFLEPPEYMATDRWYHQFDGKELSEDLRLNRSLHPITGATLTARATTDAVRRVLAIDQILIKRKGNTP